MGRTYFILGRVEGKVALSRVPPGDRAAVTQCGWPQLGMIGSSDAVLPSYLLAH
jgi:hypothetical protein